MATSNLPALPTTLAIEHVNPDRVKAVLAETELGGINPFTLKQVRVPGSGSLTWTVPDEDGSGDTPLQHMDVILLHYHRARQYYVDAYDPTNPQAQPPQCASYDGVTGHGSPGGACKVCPLSVFGGDCIPLYFTYLLFPDRIMPLKLNIPRTSLANFEAYTVRLGLTGYYHNQVITRIGLEKRKAGLGMVATFKMLAPLEEVLGDKARSYAQMIAASIVYPTGQTEASDPTAPKPTQKTEVPHVCGPYCGAGKHFQDDDLFGTREVFVGTRQDGSMFVASYGVSRPPTVTAPANTDDDDLPEE